MATLSPFRYPGAKSRLIPNLAPYINKLISNEESFSDVFVGGGSMLLHVAESFPNIKLFANDKDDWVSSFWQVVSGDKDTLDCLLELIKIEPTIDHFYNMATNSEFGLVGKAYRAIFFNRCCFSGIFKRDSCGHVTSSPIGGKLQKSAYKVNCRYNSDKLRDKILYCHKLLSGRTIVSNLDFSDFITNNDGPMYCDPPYFNKSNMLYHITVTENEHDKLSNLLNSRKKWVLSYDDCPFIRDRYSNCNIIDLAASYSINGKKQSWNNKNELIITPME